ncbi:MAG: hypothetical protein ACLGHN_01920 [Bacteriovoracia bacterium]
MISFFQSSLPFLSLALLVSCVDSSSTSRKNVPLGINQNEAIEIDGSNVQGNYAADIWPMNYNLHFKKIGAVGINRDGDNFTVTVKFKNGPKGTKVKQALFTGRRCPNLTDDLNKDAYIDILEARVAMGKITIPFDGSLDSQTEGQWQYPVVGLDGKLTYSQSTSFSKMFEDLKAVDQDPTDEIIKLKETEGITLPGRIVIFQGVPAILDVPETVATTDGESAHDSLPVGCAVLWKVDQMPVELVEE